METFKHGDRVVHPMYGNGQVLDSDESTKLVRVVFFFNNGGQYIIAVHPVSLSRDAPLPWFEVRIMWKDGVATTSEPMRKLDLRQYMSRLDENTMDAYTVTRIKSMHELTEAYMNTRVAGDDTAVKSVPKDQVTE